MQTHEGHNPMTTISVRGLEESVGYSKSSCPMLVECQAITVEEGIAITKAVQTIRGILNRLPNRIVTHEFEANPEARNQFMDSVDFGANTKPELDYGLGLLTWEEYLIEGKKVQDARITNLDHLKKVEVEA